MNSIALFIMGKKGLACLETMLNCISVELKFVIYATDKNVEKDYADEIIALCNKHNILCYNRNSFDETLLNSVSYYIAISWVDLANRNLKPQYNLLLFDLIRLLLHNVGQNFYLT